MYIQYSLMQSVADPGFPVGGGVDLVRGAVDPRGGYISKILHVKTKESGPIGGARAGRAPPRSANGNALFVNEHKETIKFLEIRMAAQSCPNSAKCCRSTLKEIELVEFIFTF